MYRDTCWLKKESKSEVRERKEGRKEGKRAGVADDLSFRGMWGLGMLTKAPALSHLSWH